MSEFVEYYMRNKMQCSYYFFDYDKQFVLSFGCKSALLQFLESYSYSPKTSRQLNRFLNEFMIPICRDDIEKAYLHCIGRTPDVADYQVSNKVRIEIWSY